MITIVEVKNPLQPSAGRTTREMDWHGGERLDSFLVRCVSPRSEFDHITVSLNGRVWERSLWGELTLKDGDCVVCAPRLAGGSLLRTLAQVGVMAAAVAVGAITGGAGFALMGLPSAATASLLAGAVSVAGNLLISAFLNNPSKKSSSPSYAFDGPQSLAQSGTVIPKGYGTFLSGGNIVSSFVDVEGADQYINALVCYGYGPARSITGLQIQGKDIAEYGNVSYYTRLGSNTQTPIPGFNRIVNGYPQDAQCLAGVPVIVPGTGDLTQELQVDVVFPDGLWVLTNDNNLIPATMTYLVEYALNGSTPGPFPGNTTAGSTTVTGVNTLLLTAGQPISGAGIPSGTTIAHVGTGIGIGAGPYGPYGTLILSAAATVTGTPNLTCTGYPGGREDWQPALYPASTEDVVTYHLDGSPYPYPTWCAMATDLAPGLGVVYATDSGSHYPGEPYATSEGVEVLNPDGTTWTYSKNCTGEWQLTVPNINLVLVTGWTAGYQSATFCQQTACYQRTTIYMPAAGKYDVRITKYGSARWGSPGDISPGDNWSPQIGQDIWVHNVNEISLLDLAYPNMVLIGVRALATGQISGANLSITALIEYGLRTLDNNVLPGALQAFEEDNPACVAADMMLDGLYGGGQWPGIVAANIDRFIDEWVAWAELNDELVDDGNGGSIRRHVFNGVFDNESNLWDQLNVVGRMSRAQLIPLGRDYGVFLDQADVPVQIFTMGNILDDSFNETWMDIDARANQVEIQFADSTRYYRQDNPLVYMDPANQDAGVVIKNVRVDGKGITVPAQAWHLARFKERCNQFLLRTGTIKCDVDAIASRPGNVVILQHDVPEWGWGGRTLPGSTAASVLVDRDDLPFVTGTSYSLIVLLASVQRYAGTVTAVAPVIDATGANTGTQLTLSSFDNANRVTRAVVTAGAASFDSPIVSTGVGLVVIQPVAGFTAAPGQSYELFDTDVLETATVTGISASAGLSGTGGLSVELGTPLSQAPADYSTYFYGPAGSQKLVRILTIRKASEFRANIEWIDYNPDVYVDATPIIGETSAQSSSNPGVTKLTGLLVPQLSGGAFIPFAALAWQNGPDTVGVGIYATYLNPTTGAPAGNPQMVARLKSSPTSWQQQMQAGTVVEYTVVGFDVNNDYAGFNSAPTVTISAVATVVASPQAGTLYPIGTGSLTQAAYPSGTATIICNPFTAQVGQLSLSIFPGGAVSIPSLLQQTTYYVYYIDFANAGGNVTPIATTNIADFLGKPGYWLIDSIVTGYASATARYVPTVRSINGGAYVSASPVGSYVAAIGSVAGTSVYPQTATSSTSATETWSGFPSLTLASAVTLYVGAAYGITPIPYVAGGSAMPASIVCSIGGTPTTLFSSSSVTGPATYTASVPAGTNLDTVSVTSTVSGAGGTITAGATEIIGALSVTPIYIQ